MPVEPLTTPGVAPNRGPVPVPSGPPGELPQPGRSPQGAAPLSPLTTPHEPPHPVLRQVGLNMGVQQLNQKVQALTDAHQSAFLSPPTPGLVLDVLKSGIDQDQYSTLFSIPKNQGDAQAQKALALHKQQNPDDYFVRSPVAAQPDNPFYRMIRQAAALPNTPTYTIPGNHPGLVTQGNIDIANRPVVHNPDGSISTVRSISIGVQGNEVLIPTVVGGKVVSNQEAINHYKQTGENLGVFSSISAANAYAESLHSQQAKAYLSPAKSSFPALQKQYPMVQMGGFPIPPALEKELGQAVGFLAQSSQVPVQKASDVPWEYTVSRGPTGGVEELKTAPLQRQAVSTIQKAKESLAAASGLAFSPGPVFNQDDATKVSNWMHSADYFKKQLAFQASQANQSVAQYVKSWNAKWGKTSPVHNGLIGHFLAAMPQQLWGHGGFWSDLASMPMFLKGASNNPLNIGLHGLTKSGGLVLGIVGGTVSQLKADAAAGTTFAAYMAGLHGDGTYEQALTKARDQLRANPTWLRIAAGGYLPTDQQEPAWLRTLDNATNVAGDLILLRKPAFTGERVAAGDLAAASRSDHLRATAGWAYQDLKVNGRDGIGRAASRLDGGQGARALVARTAKLVQDGKMSQSEFTRKVAELYSQGSTTIGSQAVTGSLLTALRDDKLPTPGPLGRGWLTGKSTIRDWLDNYNTGAVDKHIVTDSAVNLMNGVRGAVAHAAPEGAKLGYYQRELPETVFNFIRKYKLADDPQANKIESQLVRYQGTENVQGIQQMEQMLHKLWDDKYPGRGQPVDEPFRAQLSTETPSVFHFPGQADPKLNTAFDSMSQAAHETNAALNKAAKIHARIILSGLNPLTGLGGFSLFWKHAVGDGLRAAQAGVAGLLNPETKRALGELERMAQSDPAVERQLGAFLDRVRVGETRWALNKSAGNAESFKTGDILHPEGSPLNVFRKSNYLTAAGGYLRRSISAAELQGYRDGNLVQVILRDREARAAFKSNLARNPDLTVNEYAGLVSQRYQEIEAALHAHNLTFDDALNAMRAGRGHEVDAALGRFIQQHQLDFPVRGGQVEQAGPFDELTSKWVGNVIMRPNKMWRTSLGRAVLGKHYAALRAAGWEQMPAFQVAADTAEQVVKYHMLDFANRLQIEQNLRWVSYFATKHRLYWKWVLSTFLRHPGYAAAVSDFQQTLDSHGGWTLPFKVAGLQWEIPLERLVWVPGREYDETSPLAKVALDFAKSGGDLSVVGKDLTGGGTAPTLGRSDLAVRYGTKLLKIETGNAPATYGYAVAGLSQQNHDQIFKAINEYQSEFFKTHGHYAPETQAVKIVLRDQMAQEYWRANLPLPVVPLTGQTDAEHKLMQQYMSLIDPAKRREFFNQHPGFSDHFGIYENPATKIHNDTLFRRWNTAVDAYRQARASLYADAKQHGSWTLDMEKQRRDLSAALEKTRNQLLVEDAQSSGIDTHGLVPNGDTVKYGPWGRLVNKDPTFDPSHFLSALYPKLAKTVGDNVIGPLQRQMQQELTLLGDPKYVQQSNYTPTEVLTRKRELLQALDVFKSYPTDALGVVRDQYQSKYVNAYWKTYDAKFSAIAKLPSDQRKAGDAAFRAWRDSQDHPVTVNGVVFPSPIRMAWAMLPPQTRQERLSYLASKPLSDLANYELDLLGVKHPANISSVLSAVQQWKTDYARTHPDGPPIHAQDYLNIAKQLDKQPGYQGTYAYYVNTLTQPRIRQFEQTTIYRDMPAAVKAKFDVIGQAAIKNVQLQVQSKNKSHYAKEWRLAMENQFKAWVDDPSNADLKAYIAPMGPNFLNDLVSIPTGG